MSEPIHILLADDDSDDRFFFSKALKSAAKPANLTTVENGEKLMTYLDANINQLPAALFLDLNMPRKNGAECLREIKKHEKMFNLPVIIYSTSLHPEIADLLYRDGAYFYIKKGSMIELQNVINHVLDLLKNNKCDRPDRENFILNGSALRTIIPNNN